MIKKQNFLLNPPFQTNHFCFTKIHIDNIQTLIHVYSQPSVSMGSINQSLKKKFKNFIYTEYIQNFLFIIL